MYYYTLKINIVKDMVIFFRKGVKYMKMIEQKHRYDMRAKMEKHIQSQKDFNGINTRFIDTN
jgi:hypothetical protein